MFLTRFCALLCGFALLLQIVLPAEVSAKLYTWTDRNVIVRRTYYPPPPDQVQQSSARAQSAPAQLETSANQVELYVTSWCPYCKKAIQYFQERGIAYTAYDIERDGEAARRKQSLDGQGGVPFAVINGIGVHGFAPDRYEQALR